MSDVHVQGMHIHVCIWYIHECMVLYSIQHVTCTELSGDRVCINVNLLWLCPNIILTVSYTFNKENLWEFEKNCAGTTGWVSMDNVIQCRQKLPSTGKKNKNLAPSPEQETLPWRMTKQSSSITNHAQILTFQKECQSRVNSPMTTDIGWQCPALR